MSHFTVLVALKEATEEALEAALQPFHEYECTGTKDEHVVFVDHHDEVKSDWETETNKAYRSPNGDVYGGHEEIFYREPSPEEAKKVGSFAGTGCGGGIMWSSRDWCDGRGYRAKVRFIPEGFEEFQRPVQDQYKTIELFASEWHGYSEIENGRIGCYTNPNAQWDWWSVGGRWSNFLSLKDGTKADDAKKADIDFDGMRQEEADKAAKTYDQVAAITNGRGWTSWEQARDDRDDIDDARKFYNGQQVIIDIKEKFDHPFMDKDVFLQSREDYVDSMKRKAITTFATLVDGKWAAKGEMGWWACVSDEVSDWPTDFQRIIDSVPDDHHLVVVDCHI
jgi:hypothetical protein